MLWNIVLKKDRENNNYNKRKKRENTSDKPLIKLLFKFVITKVS